MSDALELIWDCVDKAYFLETESVQREARNRAALALLGLWGKRYQYSWRVTTSKTEDDRLGALFKTISRSESKMDLYASIETLSNVTMLPIHLIARNM